MPLIMIFEEFLKMKWDLYQHVNENFSFCVCDFILFYTYIQDTTLWTG